MSIIAWKNVMIIQKYDGKIVKIQLQGDPFWKQEDSRDIECPSAQS